MAMSTNGWLRFETPCGPIRGCAWRMRPTSSEFLRPESTIHWITTTPRANSSLRRSRRSSNLKIEFDASDISPRCLAAGAQAKLVESAALHLVPLDLDRLYRFE